MPGYGSLLTRRSVLLASAGSVLYSFQLVAAETPVITVHKDPDCGCCAGWVQHLEENGFVTKVIETATINRVKARLGVPNDVAACHTAEAEGYLIEGHVPAAAVRRLLTEKPSAQGLAVPGMPVGSPGMGGDAPEVYEVILFGPGMRQPFMRFKGEQPV